MSLSPYVERITEATQGIQAAKAAIASAIIAKGGTLASADGLADFSSAIAAIPSGGGTGYDWHTVDFTLVSTGIPNHVLAMFIEEAACWYYEPTDGSTQLNTFSCGSSWKRVGESGTDKWLENATSAIGFTFNSPGAQYMVNDQTYNAVRQRGNLSGIPAGEYRLHFYGIAREAAST